jgi:hypothetical protein
VVLVVCVEMLRIWPTNVSCCTFSKRSGQDF